METLWERGLGEADEAFLGGSSAGGFRVRDNLDRMAASLPGVTVKGLNDGGRLLVNPQRRRGRVGGGRSGGKSEGKVAPTIPARP